MSKVSDLRVALAIPVQGPQPLGFTHDLVRLAASTAAKRPDVEVKLYMVRRECAAQARHELVTAALAANRTHILFLSPDLRFPPNLLTRLLDHGKDIVGVNYVTNYFPIEPTAIIDDSEGYTPLVMEEGADGLRDVVSMGLGAVLIRMPVFRDIGEPWFLTGFDPVSQRYIPDDVYFCQRLRDAGKLLWIDQELSNAVAHIGDWDFRHEHAVASHPEMVAAHVDRHV